MTRSHPQTALAPFLRGDLTAAERERVELHLRDCAACRADVESFRVIMTALAREAATVPEPNWSRYRAELHRKIAAQDDRGPDLRQHVWQVPRLAWASMATAGAAVAAIVLVITLSHRPSVSSPPVDELAMEDVIGGTDVGLLSNYSMVQHLDLLENYDVIEHLDQLAPSNQPNENQS